MSKQKRNEVTAVNNNKIVADPTPVSFDSSMSQLDFKIVVLGDSGSGKSSIIDAFLNERACKQIVPGLAHAESQSKSIRMKDRNNVKVKVWDSLGNFENTAALRQ